ncbi:MAG: deoxyribose-phosphate aldolase [Weeksellaceae bacterium]|nr:deoxyribose-phosphate aldolase [Weeksellaceae bacterium]
MDVKNFLDSTYLKTPEAAGISLEENLKILQDLVDEAAQNGIYAVMIRPQYVKEIREYIDERAPQVVLGTVIGFPEGTMSTAGKLEEAEKALSDGADELDFVMNYSKFLAGEVEACADEIAQCNALVLNAGKVIKWIIEAAAMSDEEIARATALVAKTTLDCCSDKASNVFIKSSTGFYVCEDGKPNGATPHNIKIMLENAQGLPVKAAGGVRSREEAEAMIDLGVKRIGTSSAAAIVAGGKGNAGY